MKGRDKCCNCIRTIGFFFNSAQLVEISSCTGIVLDPVYTLKGVQGMLAELQKNPGRFKGNRILYIHTGTLVVFNDVLRAIYTHIFLLQVVSLEHSMDD